MRATAGEKRREVMKGGFSTRRDAEAALAEFIGYAARGHRPPPAIPNSVLSTPWNPRDAPYSSGWSAGAYGPAVAHVSSGCQEGHVV